MVPLPEDADAARALCAGLDASCRLPGSGDAPPSVVVATLDLNQGHTLPAEELSAAAGAGRERAYLSNVAVAAGARRRGAANSLISFASDAARKAGVRHLYVHVVADNEAARALYAAAGFSVETEESAAAAHGLGRPRRLLLHKALQ